jgi:hypothetical protein
MQGTGETPAETVSTRLTAILRTTAEEALLPVQRAEQLKIKSTNRRMKIKEEFGKMLTRVTGD